MISAPQAERLRQMIFEAKTHADAGNACFSRTSIIGGYEQAKWRLTEVSDRLAEIDDMFEALLVEIGKNGG
jgi:hypothetical protein